MIEMPSARNPLFAKRSKLFKDIARKDLFAIDTPDPGAAAAVSDVGNLVR